MPARKTKRADNRYMTSIDLGRDENGKRIRKYFYGKTQKEAKEKLDDFKKRREEGLKGDSSTLYDWIIKWIETSSTKESMRRANRLFAMKLDQFLGEIDISEVRMIDIARFAQSMADKSFSTVKKVRGTTNRIFQDAVRNRLINYNPCDGVRWDYSFKGTHRFSILFGLTCITPVSKLLSCFVINI